MKLKILMAISLVGFLSGTLQASEQRGALVLNKIPIYEFDDARRIGCTGIYDVKFGQDVSDMRPMLPIIATHSVRGVMK